MILFAQSSALGILSIIAMVMGVFVAFSYFAFRRNQGFWGNMICLMNITFASVFAIGFFEDFSYLLASIYAGGMFFWDLVAYNVIFFFTYFMLTVFTNRLSKVKVRFPQTIETAGNYITLLLCAVLIGGLYISTLTYLTSVGVSEDDIVDTYLDPDYSPPLSIIQLELLSGGEFAPLCPIAGSEPYDGQLFLEQQAARRAEHLKASEGGWTFQGENPERDY